MHTCYNESDYLDLLSSFRISAHIIPSITFRNVPEHKLSSSVSELVTFVPFANSLPIFIPLHGIFRI